MRNWKYAFIPYFTKSADEAIDILKRAGYDGVEWNLQLHFETPDKLKPLAMKTQNTVWKSQTLWPHRIL